MKKILWCLLIGFALLGTATSVFAGGLSSGEWNIEIWKVYKTWQPSGDCEISINAGVNEERQRRQERHGFFPVMQVSWSRGGREDSSRVVDIGSTVTVKKAYEVKDWKVHIRTGWTTEKSAMENRIWEYEDEGYIRIDYGLLQTPDDKHCVTRFSNCTIYDIIPLFDKGRQAAKKWDWAKANEPKIVLKSSQASGDWAAGTFTQTFEFNYTAACNPDIAKTREFDVEIKYGLRLLPYAGRMEVDDIIGTKKIKITVNGDSKTITLKVPQAELSKSAKRGNASNPILVTGFMFDVTETIPGRDSIISIHFLEVDSTITVDPKVDKNAEPKADAPKKRVPSEEPKETTSTTSVFNITSTPSPADLHVDGNWVGNTPATVELPFGQHKIVVKKKGYKDWEKDLKVSMKGKFSLCAELEKIGEEAKTEVKAETESGDKIVFISKRDGKEDVYVMNADGSDVKRLTSGSSKKNMPCWSPDGKKIVFIATEGRDDVIYVMNADGSDVKELKRYIIQSSPSWSPDGKKILFSSCEGSADIGKYEIYVMNSNGSNIKRLTNIPSDDDSNPTWSPDGKKIAFSSNREGVGLSDVWIMDADGSNVKRLTNNLRCRARIHLSWSPDGKKIAFSAEIFEETDKYRFRRPEIYIMDADGSNIKRLTTIPKDKDIYDAWPSWSPDSKKIAFQSSRDGNGSEIYIMDADGSNVKKLTNSPGQDSQPSWHP